MENKIYLRPVKEQGSPERLGNTSSAYIMASFVMTLPVNLNFETLSIKTLNLEDVSPSAIGITGFLMDLLDFFSYDLLKLLGPVFTWSDFATSSEISYSNLIRYFFIFFGSTGTTSISMGSLNIYSLNLPTLTFYPLNSR